MINLFYAIHCQRGPDGELQSKLYVRHLPREWNFFFNSISHVFAPKTGGSYGITTLNQEISIAIAQEHKDQSGSFDNGSISGLSEES